MGSTGLRPTTHLCRTVVGAVALLALVGLTLMPLQVFAVVALPILAAPVVTCWRCARTAHTTDRLGYAWFAAAFVLLALGNEAWIWLDVTNRQESLPNIADGIFLAAYVCLVIALIAIVVRRYGASDVEGWLDTAILTIAALVISWLVVATPMLDSDIPASQKIVQLAYPLIICLVVALMCRIAFAPGRARTSDRYLLAAALTGLVIDAVDALRAGDGTMSFSVPGKPLTALGSALVAIAAGHASRERPSHPLLAPARPGRSGHEPATSPLVDTPGYCAPSHRRLAVLSAAVLVAPAAMAYRLAVGSYASMPVFVAASTLVALVVVARLLLAVSRSTETALIDPLVRVLNRRGVEDAIGRLITKGATNAIAVLFVDLDGFKSVNDRLGHAGGDEVLAHVADRLVKTARSCDTVGRLGGDEFVVVVPDLRTPLDEAASSAFLTGRRLLAAVEQPLRAFGVEIVISASIGVALVPPERFADVSAAQLLHEADLAMYAAKRSGKGRVTVVDMAPRVELTPAATTL